jgi:putative DNA primase/helicase
MADVGFDDRISAAMDAHDRGDGAKVIEDAATIIRLARMDILEYDRCRLAEADKLQVRASILDREVQAQRASMRREHARANDTVAPLPPQFSDDAIACKFSDRHAEELLHVSVWNQWLVFKDGRWLRDPVLTVFEKSRLICREVARDAASEKDGDVLAAGITSARTVSAVERLARSDPRHARAAEDFDADPWLLNTPGGVVNLKTGKMRRHSPSDLFTKVTAIAPGGECPRFLLFLAEITQQSAAVIAYIRRFIGYTLTGQITEHAFMFLYGPGKNGKSVLLNIVAYILGDYAQTAMSDVFTLTRGSEGHASKLAALRGARMVAVSETEEGRPWAEARIKAWTGGDKVSANFMHGNPFEFSPVCKLWFSGNHKPPLRNPDAAMRRRLHLLPLSYIPPKPDLALAEALQAEAGGILAWAISGCLEWQKTGLAPPPAVCAATDDYFADQNAIELWLGERCNRLPTGEVGARALFHDWRAFAGARGDDPRSEKWFSAELEKLFVKDRKTGGVVFKGIAFKPSPAEAERGTM